MNKVLPKLYSYEKIRQKKYGLVLCLSIISFLLIIFFAFNVYTTMQESNNIPAIIIFILIFILFVISSLLNRNFKNLLKEKLYPDILNSFGEIEWYNQTLPRPLNIYGSELFDYIDNYNYDDIFIGKYKGVEYIIAEAHFTRKERDSKGNSTTVTVFKGIILNLPFNKTIKAHTIIKPKQSTFVRILGMVFGFISLCMGFLSGDIITKIIILSILIVSICVYYLGIKKFKDVKLEDIEIDKDYSIVSEDQVEARYLITPTFMERFKNLKRIYNSKDIGCAIFGDQIMFALSTDKDIFEIGDIFHSLTDSKQIDKFYNEITAIIGIIEEFKLYEKTGL